MQKNLGIFRILGYLKMVDVGKVFLENASRPSNY